MKTTTNTGNAVLTAAITLTLAVGAALSTRPAHAEPYVDRARVISAAPEYERVNIPRQECYDEYEPRDRYNAPSEHSYGGAVVGGITGAIVGNQIGKGHGREAATAVGAVAGAIVGDKIQNRDYRDDREPRLARRCRDVPEVESRLTGYRVVYEYDGRRFTTVMPNNPGNFLRVRVSVDPYE